MDKVTASAAKQNFGQVLERAATALAVFPDSPARRALEVVARATVLRDV